MDAFAYQQALRRLSEHSPERRYSANPETQTARRNWQLLTVIIGFWLVFIAFCNLIFSDGDVDAPPYYIIGAMLVGGLLLLISSNPALMGKQENGHPPAYAFRGRNLLLTEDAVMSLLEELKPYPEASAIVHGWLAQGFVLRWRDALAIRDFLTTVGASR